MNNKIAIMGDSESIKGFAAVGFDLFELEQSEDAEKILRRVAESGEYGIIYITEEFYATLTKECRRYSERMTPAIIPLPGIKGNTDLGKTRLKSFVEKAVGSDIMFNE